ncbi:hypothetical protein LCGC14_2528350, partial [marine sediment metagenome]
AGAEGHEFVVRHRPAAPASGPASILTQRTVCANGMKYTFMLYYQTDQAERVRAAVAVIAKGLELFKPRTTATSTATASAPATSTAPATAPAEK